MVFGDAATIVIRTERDGLHSCDNVTTESAKNSLKRFLFFEQIGRDPRRTTKVLSSNEIMLLF